MLTLPIFTSVWAENLKCFNIFIYHIVKTEIFPAGKSICRRKYLVLSLNYKHRERDVSYYVRLVYFYFICNVIFISLNQ